MPLSRSATYVRGETLFLAVCTEAANSNPSGLNVLPTFVVSELGIQRGHLFQRSRYGSVTICG